MVVLWCGCITNKTLIHILEVRDNAVILRLNQTTSGGGIKSISTANQKVSSGRVTATFVTLILTRCLTN